jgi:hypothetical protein
MRLHAVMILTETLFHSRTVSNHGGKIAKRWPSSYDQENLRSMAPPLDPVLQPIPVAKANNSAKEYMSARKACTEMSQHPVVRKGYEC